MGREEDKISVLLLSSVNITLTELSCEELSFAVASLRALLGKRSVAV